MDRLMRDNIALVGLSPFEAPHFEVTWQRGMTLLDIAKAAKVEPWFYEYGVIKIDGKRYVERDMWRFTKPKQGVTVECCVELNKGAGKFIKKAIRVIATVAVAVGTKVATAINPILGAAVGVGGQLLLRGLTPAPTRGGRSGAANNGRGGSGGRSGSLGGGGSGGSSTPDAVAQRELSQSGVTTNTVAQGESLSFVIGKKRVSPNLLAPPWVTLENDIAYSHAIYGMMGRHKVSELKLNGVDFQDVQGIEYEVFEGDGSENLLSFAAKTYQQRSIGASLQGFRTVFNTETVDVLHDVLTPDNSTPKFTVLKSQGVCDEFWISFVMPGGLVSQAGLRHSVPIRVEMRRVGDLPWRKLPELHLKDRKGAGAFRRQIKLVFGEALSGRWLGRSDYFDFHYGQYRSGPGQSWEYFADPYFNNVVVRDSVVPVLISNSNGVVTVTSSSAEAGRETWHVFDNNSATFWTAGSLIAPQWIEVDHGDGNAKTIRSYAIIRRSPVDASALAGMPVTWKVFGSNDGVAETLIHDQNNTTIFDSHFCQVDIIQPFRFHRFEFLSSRGGALSIGTLSLFEVDNVSVSYGTSDFLNYTPSFDLARYVSLTPDGANIFLDPSSWPRGEYEFRVKKGLAYQTDLAVFGAASAGDCDVQSYNGSTANTGWFTYGVLNSYPYVTPSQLLIQSEVEIEATTTVVNERPINPQVEPLLTRIGVRCPNITMDSVSAIFEGYARPFAGGVWQDQPQITRNPAAHFRDALLRETLNALPVNGELIDEDSLQAWFTDCQVNGYTCDMIIQGRSIADVLAVTAACGNASVRKSETIGVVMDRDRSAEPITQMLTPLNSRTVSTAKPFKTIPHALRVEFSDGENEERSKSVIVYREGFDASTARIIEAVGYEGLDTEVKNVARARFDLRQMQYRNIEVRKEVGLEGLSMQRGTLVGVSDDVIMRDVFATLIKAVIVSAGNVTGLVLATIVELSKVYGQVSFEGDILAPTTSFGFKARLVNGLAASHEIVEIADTDTITLVTPVPDTGQFEVDGLISIGPFGREMRRMIVREREAAGVETYTLTLVPEAPELFAPDT